MNGAVWSRRTAALSMARRPAWRRSAAARKAAGGSTPRTWGGSVVHTSDMDRLNATFRERLAPLARRSRALARQTLTLHEGMLVVGTVYNFCTQHESRGDA